MSESLLEKVRDTAAKATETLDVCITRVGEMLNNPDGPYNDKLASHLAYLTKYIAAVMESLRKLEAHDDKTVKGMSPAKKDALVQAYIADLPRDRRAALRAALDELDREAAA